MMGVVMQAPLDSRSILLPCGENMFLGHFVTKMKELIYVRRNKLDEEIVY
jgi:hypothetical protein